MGRTSSNGKSALLDDVIGRLRDRPSGDVTRLETFIRHYYARVVGDDLAELDVDGIYGAAVAHYRFAAVRGPREAKIRVYNPNIEEHGWRAPHTVVEIVTDDSPFLVDSISNALTGSELGIHLVVHPVFAIRRDASGELVDVAPGGAEKGQEDDGWRAESFMHFEIDEQAHADRRKEIEAHLAAVLSDVRAAIEDWRPMVARLADILAEWEAKTPPIEESELEEARAFLDWIKDNHFTLLGYREHEFAGDDPANVTAVEGSGLGILRDPNRHVMRAAGQLTAFTPEILHALRQPAPIFITKANVRSTVHRNTHLDYIGVKKYGPDGNVIGERRFVGLFTSAAYNRNTRDIPILRHKAAAALRRANFPPDSHDGKALLNVIETYPRDELFQMTSEELFENASGILRLRERPRVKIFVRQDKFERFVSILVYVPREGFHTELRIRIGKILADAYSGEVTAYYPQFADDPLARIHYIVRTKPGSVPSPDIRELEESVRRATRTWGDDLKDALLAEHGEDKGNRLWARYRNAFRGGYSESVSAAMALHDIDKAETLKAPGDTALNLYRTLEDEPDTVRFKLFHAGALVPLSDCLPMLENMGLRVSGEHPFSIEPEGGPFIALHDFQMREAQGRAIDLTGLKQRFEALFAEIWSGRVENDGFNRLVLAGLQCSEIVILRAYCKYLRQAGVAFSQAYMEETLARNPAITGLLIRIFEARFDPNAKTDSNARRDALKAIGSRFNDALDEVASLDEDRILRRFRNAIECTLRTNFYQTAGDGSRKTHLSFKLDSRRLDDLPAPRPHVEIFVYSPSVEGVHLRGGEVARGGLRWSDRREDFRTEVLGLMKAQQVKNAVIVPVGSKGGFVPKRLPEGGSREEIQEEAIASYKLFISGLLDLTDNLAGGEAVVPANVIRYDGDDPYLVVAADKGTASFSDIANNVAKDYGFWLGDAFASGGSAGYDHKKMGITARGAWEAVKRHFREDGRDIQTTPFTVVGVGDMSGDVFGNGMLLSPQIRLVAAFDHRDIFVDPDPDAARSYAERKRLFELPRSSWEDYDEEIISDGGGVFSRKLKSIALTPAMKALTGLDEASVMPNELIQALLRADIDLLWFGGIGTYVKSSEESNNDVGDRANDVVRVDARELRAKVIGEGANLAITQKGRIEFARHGGRINTDAVDNAAGVDCSDHEVNIKIPLGDVVANGDMTMKQRNKLLVDMTDDVAELVLTNNYQQTLAITLEEVEAAELLEDHVRFMRTNERAGALSRELESLPNDEEIEELRTAGHGLTRPEIAVLMAYAKIGLFRELVASEVPDDDSLEADLIAYFPDLLRRNQADVIRSHRLRREIIATLLANSLVNRAGVTFAAQAAQEVGATTADVARAFAAARGAFDMRALWASVNGLDNRVAADAQHHIHLMTRDLLWRATLWFLRDGPRPLKIGAAVSTYGPGVAHVRDTMEHMLSPFECDKLSGRTQELMDMGVPADIAAQAATLDQLVAALDIVRVAERAGKSVDDVGRAFFALGTELGLDWLRAEAAEIPQATHWDQLAVHALIDDLWGQQRALTARALELADGASGPDAVASWARRQSAAVSRAQNLIEDLRSTGALDVSKLAFANRQMRSLVGL